MAVGILDVKIKFRLGQRTLTLDYRRVPFRGWGELKQTTTFTQRTLFTALNDYDLDAITALIWLERKQRERSLRYMDVYQELATADDDQDFELLDLVMNGKSLNGDEEIGGEADGVAGQDPTVGSS